jgi:hypothetical protein
MAAKLRLKAAICLKGSIGEDADAPQQNVAGLDLGAEFGSGDCWPESVPLYQSYAMSNCGYDVRQCSLHTVERFGQFIGDGNTGWLTNMGGCQNADNQRHTCGLQKISSSLDLFPTHHKSLVAILSNGVNLAEPPDLSSHYQARSSLHSDHSW